MCEEVVLQIDGVSLTIEKNENQIAYVVHRQDMKYANEELFELLEVSDTFFLPIDLQISPSKIICTVTLSKNTICWLQMLADATEQEKIANCLKTRRLVEVTKTIYTTTLHPENVYVNLNQEVQCGYRGLQDIMPPFYQDDLLLFLERRALIISSLFPKYTYEELVNNLFLLTDMPDEAGRLYMCKDNDELDDVLYKMESDLLEFDVQSTKVERYVHYGGYILFIMIFTWQVVVMFILRW